MRLGMMLLLDNHRTHRGHGYQMVVTPMHCSKIA
jgi:hypothetical protein